jgi:hypothetical protein
VRPSFITNCTFEGSVSRARFFSLEDHKKKLFDKLGITTGEEAATLLAEMRGYNLTLRTRSVNATCLGVVERASGLMPKSSTGGG